MRFYSYPYKEISINSAFLEIPAEYQRKLQMGKVKQMVAEFNGIIVNPPKVSYRDGRNTPSWASRPSTAAMTCPSSAGSTLV